MECGLLSTIDRGPVSSGIVPARPPEGSQCGQPVDYPSVALALEQIYRLAPNSIIGFANPPRLDSSTQSATRAFRREVLPWMHSRGYHDLVLQIFPHGSSPANPIEREIGEFNRSGTIGPIMRGFIPVADERNYERLLATAHRLGIRIHSGGFTYDSSRPNFVPTYTERQRQTAINSGHVIQYWAQRTGGRVVSLSTYLNNDISPVFPPLADYSYVPRLNRAWRQRFVEIDTVFPDITPNIGSFRYLCLPPGCRWDSYFPQLGVALVQGNTAKSYLLYFPPRP